MSWHTGLCACTMDVNQCLDNMLCFPCSTSRQINAVENAQPNTCTVGKCLCPGMLLPCAGCIVRRKIVDKYKIDEGLITSLVMGLCPCSHCQHHRELTKHNCWPGGNCLHKQPGNYDMA